MNKFDAMKADTALVHSMLETFMRIHDLARQLQVPRKDDEHKARWDLVPWESMERVVDVLTFGAREYGDDNWKLVPHARRRYLAATLRHIVAWIRGAQCDAKSGQPNLAHAICCLLFLLEFDREQANEK